MRRGEAAEFDVRNPSGRRGEATELDVLRPSGKNPLRFFFLGLTPYIFIASRRPGFFVSRRPRCLARDLFFTVSPPQRRP